MTDTKSAQFVGSILAGLRYWQTRTEDISEGALLQLDTERQNLLRIIQYGQQLPEARRETAVLILNTYHYVERRAFWQEWIALTQMAVDWSLPDAQLQGQLLNRLGALYRHNSQFPEALAVHQAAEKLVEPLGDLLLLNHIYLSLCSDYRQMHKYQRAAHYGEMALAGFQASNAPLKWQAATLNDLGLIAEAQGDFDKAEEKYHAAIKAWKIVGQQTELLRTLGNLITSCRYNHKYAAAIQYYEEAEAFFTKETSEFEKTAVRINVGGVYFESKQYELAEQTYRLANSPYLQKSNHMYLRALASQCLGNTLLKLERFDEAEAYLQESTSLWQLPANTLMLANTLGTLAEVMAVTSRVEKAIALYDEALTYLTAFPENAWAKKLEQEFFEQKQALLSAP